MVVMLAAALVLPVATSYASSPSDEVGKGFNAAAGADKCKDDADGNNSCSLTDNVQIIVNALLFLIGAVSVIMIIIGGIRYVTSNGDSSQITSAKNTIMYAVIGLIIALMAFAIVNFVVKQFVN